MAEVPCKDYAHCRDWCAVTVDLRVSTPLNVGQYACAPDAELVNPTQSAVTVQGGRLSRSMVTPPAHVICLQVSVPRIHSSEQLM